jgi:N-methylhydantoinase A
MATLIGIDVGGTFTDFFILDRTLGCASVYKIASTPQDPAAAIAAGLADLIATGRVKATDVERVSHGTTVGTNALIQRRDRGQARERTRHALSQQDPCASRTDARR